MKDNKVILNSDDCYEQRKRANKALEDMKKYESTHTLHTRQVGKKTIVCCKNEERFKEYENLYKFKDITV